MGMNVNLGLQEMTRKMTLHFRKQRLEAEYRNAELNGEKSDRDIRNILSAAIYSTVPKEPWIIEYYPDQKVVRYETWDRDVGEELWESDYVLDETATLVGEPRKLEFSGVYTVVASNLNPQKEETVANLTKETKELIDGLISCECSPYSEESRTALEPLTDEQLEAIAAQFTEVKDPDVVPDPAPVPVASTTPVDDPPVPNTVTLSAQEYSEMQTLLAEKRTNEAATRDRLTKLLIAHDPLNLTQSFLKDFSVANLEVMVSSHGLDKPIVTGRQRADFSIQPARERDEIPSINAEPPRGISAAIKRKNA